jgi:hypothetical protein
MHLMVSVDQSRMGVDQKLELWRWTWYTFMT